MEVLVGTKNPHKLQEITEILQSPGVSFLPLPADAPDVAETGATFEDNAALKALTWARHFQKWVLADDSGLEVDALGGKPGVHSARFAGPEQHAARNMAKLLSELRDVPLADRTARFRCCVALADPHGVRIAAAGACEGVILEAPRGSGGFGYDPVFYVPSLRKTFAEASSAEKHALSHRGQALRHVRAQLPEVTHG